MDASERLGLGDAIQEDEWEDALACEPEPVATIGPERLDAVLAAFADFADLKSPWLRGHSRRVATLAEAAGRHAGLDAAACDDLRRAGLVHDLGRVAVENGIWDKPGPLTTAERERVRLHAYSTERILVRCRPLGALGELAASHHERLDGSGYHRSLSAGVAVQAGPDPRRRRCLRGAHGRAAAPERARGGRCRRRPRGRGRARPGRGRTRPGRRRTP